MVSLAQSKQENILFQFYKHKARGGHRKQHESDFVSRTYHRCYILIQTLTSEWKWHSASCNMHPVVAQFDWATTGLVICLGQGVIHDINSFSAAALQVFSVSFTTANHILI